MDKTLISILGGLGGMFGWGTSDFFANQASDTVGHYRAFFWSQVAGLVLMGFAALIFSEGLFLTIPILILIIITGVSYALGYLYFYNGFERGNVSVVSAVINLQTLFIFAISYFVYKQSLTTFQVPALILLLTGIILVSVNFQDLKGGGVSLVKGVKETVIAATLFGVLSWPLNEYIVERVDWSAASFAVKLVAIIFVLLISKIFSKTLTLPKSLTNKDKKIIVAVGLLEAFAVISLSYGVSVGDAIIVAPIASALTVVTVTLAMIFLKEKLTRTQGLGIILTIIGIVLTGF